MVTVEFLKQEITMLSPCELAKFRLWFTEFDGDQWDRQIEADAAAGKFDKMAADALAEYHAGKACEL